jgi:hypothetical protein
MSREPLFCLPSLEALHRLLVDVFGAEVVVQSNPDEAAMLEGIRQAFNAGAAEVTLYSRNRQVARILPNGELHVLWQDRERRDG